MIRVLVAASLLRGGRRSGCANDWLGGPSARLRARIGGQAPEVAGLV